MNRTYFDNTLLEWLIAFSIVLGSFIVGKLVYWLLSHWIRLFTRRTRTHLDNIVIDAIDEPLVALIVIWGTRLSIDRLVLPDNVYDWAGRIQGMAIALTVAWMVTRLYDSLHREYVVQLVQKSRTDLDNQLLGIFKGGIKAIAWALGIVVALNNAGYDVGALLAGLGIGGLAFALAAQDTVSNIFGGITIFMQRPFRVGDLIEFEGQQMIVEEIGLRSTRLTDFDRGYLITMPNSKFTNNAVANISAFPGHIISLSLKLAPSTAAAQMERALQLLQEIMETHAEVQPGKIRFHHLSDALGISLFYTIADFRDRFRVQTEINLEIMRRFSAEGIRLALPAYVTKEMMAADGGSSVFE